LWNRGEASQLVLVSKPREIPMDEITMDKVLRRAIRPAIVLMVAIVAALAVTAERNGVRIARSDQPVPGSSGIAHPHPPLDRAPGQALRIPL
jgi:hypothetical protein